METKAEYETETLQGMIEELAKVEHELAYTRTLRIAMLNAFMESEEYKNVKDSEAVLAQASESLRGAIKETGEAEYTATGSKRPHPAVGVRLMPRVCYDQAVAVAYCREKLPNALKLDVSAFEKFAKAVHSVQPLDFVRIEHEPQITISTDLSQYLPKETEVVAEF